MHVKRVPALPLSADAFFKLENGAVSDSVIGFLAIPSEPRPNSHLPKLLPTFFIVLPLHTFFFTVLFSVSKFFAVPTSTVVD